MPFEAKSLLDVSHLMTFLGGAIVGAAGTYLADRFTDQRRKGEAEAAEKKRFSALERQMSPFLAEIKTDLTSNPELAIREFVILPNERITFNHGQPRFEYYEDKCPGAVNYVGLLIEAGFVEAVRSTSTPIYRLKEPFVERLLA